MLLMLRIELTLLLRIVLLMTIMVKEPLLVSASLTTPTTTATTASSTTAPIAAPTSSSTSSSSAFWTRKVARLLYQLLRLPTIIGHWWRRMPAFQPVVVRLSWLLLQAIRAGRLRSDFRYAAYVWHIISDIFVVRDAVEVIRVVTNYDYFLSRANNFTLWLLLKFLCLGLVNSKNLERRRLLLCFLILMLV